LGAYSGHLTTFRSRLGLRSIRSQRTCSENPAVDRCPATAGVDVKLPFAIATMDVAIGGKGNIRAGSAVTCPAQVLDLPVPKFEIARIDVLVGFLSLECPPSRDRPE
jgi:hypothetical protein